ncbi:MAG: hypothetical protein Q4A67_03430 [Aerococcus sp.]|nr:hypothetical protein [Aerococcus sp.]
MNNKIPLSQWWLGACAVVIIGAIYLNWYWLLGLAAVLFGISLYWNHKGK